jgi:hypothetical protein
MNNISLENMQGMMNMPSLMPMNMPMMTQPLMGNMQNMIPNNIAGTSIASLINQPSLQPNFIPQNHNIHQHDQNYIPRNPDMSHLTSDINKLLDDYMPSHELRTDDTESEEEISIKKKDKSYIPEFLKEPLLLYIVYIFLSLDFVKKIIGSYVKQINPDTDGNVNFLGIFIYGAILVSLFVLLKLLLIRKK